MFFFSVNDNVERKQNKRRCTRSPYFVTQARARAHAREWRKGKETKRKKEKEGEEEEERYMHGRRVAMIYENKSIERHSLCVAMVLLCREEEKEREKKKKEKRKKREWQCSLLVEGKVLYEKSRFHRPMLLMIMTVSREEKKYCLNYIFIYIYSLLLMLLLRIEDYDHQ